MHIFDLFVRLAGVNNKQQMKSKKQKQREHKDKILNSIPIFLAKTYRIVDNPDHASIIEWVPDENGFIVKNITDLTEKVFPKYFKHTNYASFVRQLNLYGFHKVRSNQEGQIFTHNYFLKNNPDLLTLIKRRNANAPENQKPQNSQSLVLRNAPPSILMKPNPESSRDIQLQRQLGSLAQKHESLQNLVSILAEQNKEIIMQNKSFINKITSMDDNYKKKLETLIFLMVFGLKNGDTNITVPQKLNNMISAFATGKKEKKGKNTSTVVNEGPSQAMELFKKPAQDESRFNNKNIEQILQMLKMESEGENSSFDQLMVDGKPGAPALNSLTPSHQNNHQEQILTPQLSPIPSLRSLPSRFQNEKIDDDYDFLDKLEHSELDLEGSKQ